MQSTNTLLTVFLTMAMVTISGSMSQIFDKYGKSVPFEYYFFILFFVIMRIKIFLDDLNEVEKADRTSLCFKVEFSFGILFWFLWILAAVILPGHIKEAYIILIGSIFIATIILFASNNKRKFDYFYFNIGYIIILVLLALTPESKSIFISLLLVVAIVISILDFQKNASFDVFNR